MFGTALRFGNLGRASGPSTPIGGTITKITVNGINYNLHTFTTNGIFVVPSGITVDLLVVGGGGTGGVGSGYTGGGGGANVLKQLGLSISSGSYSIVVAQKSQVTINGSSTAKNGNSSSALNYTAIGGYSGNDKNGGNSGNNHAGANYAAQFYDGELYVGSRYGAGAGAGASSSNTYYPVGGDGMNIDNFLNDADSSYFSAGGGSILVPNSYVGGTTTGQNPGAGGGGKGNPSGQGYAGDNSTYLPTPIYNIYISKTIRNLGYGSGGGGGNQLGGDGAPGVVYIRYQV